MNICETVLYSGNEERVHNLCGVLAKFGLKFNEYVRNPKAAKKYHTGIEFGPNEVKTFNSLAVDGTCHICKRHKKINPYIRECFECIVEENRKADKKFKSETIKLQRELGYFN